MGKEIGSHVGVIKMMAEAGVVDMLCDLCTLDVPSTPDANHAPTDALVRGCPPTTPPLPPSISFPCLRRDAVLLRNGGRVYFAWVRPISRATKAHPLPPSALLTPSLAVANLVCSVGCRAARRPVAARRVGVAAAPERALPGQFPTRAQRRGDPGLGQRRDAAAHGVWIQPGHGDQRLRGRA